MNKIIVVIVFLFCFSPLKSEEQRFIALSDLHFDAYHALDKVAFQKLASLDVDEWPAFFEQLDQPVSSIGNDTNYALMVSTLAAAAKSFPDAPFVLYSGDFLGHNWQRQYDALAPRTLEDDPDAYHAFTKKALRLIASEFQSHFPNSVILPTLGNEDAFCSDYWIQPNGHFLEAFADIWKPLLKDTIDRSEFVASFNAHGCYVADLPAFSNHKLIVLNSLLWSDSYCDEYNSPIKNKTNCCDCSDAGTTPGEAQFTWFEEQLLSAQKNGKKVWLLMHIPPGLDSYTEEQSGGRNAAAHFWSVDFTDRYLKLLDQYREVIQLSFAGHTHKDDYRIDSPNGSPALLTKIIPSVSPIFGNNPAFQVFQVDVETDELTNWKTHFLGLKFADNKKPTRQWAIEYDAHEAYGLDNFNAETITNLFEIMRKHPSDSQAKRYGLFYEVSATVIPQELLPIHFCVILNPTFQDYQSCLTEDGFSAPVKMKSTSALRRLAKGVTTKWPDSTSTHD